MFFQEATPDTSGYMIAGFAIAFLVMALYVASIYVRSRNLRQDMTILSEMEEQEPAPASIRSSRSNKPGNVQELDKNNGHRPAKTVTKTTSRK